MRESLAACLLAAQFLTRLPLPARGYTPERWARAPHHFATIGLGLGLVAAGLFWAMSALWSQPVAALAMLATLLFLTGALHEDGLADCLDGLGGGRDKAAALAIMRDSQIGSYGALGLIVVLGLGVVVLASVPVLVGMGALVLGHTLSRAMMAQALGQGRYLRDKGAGSGLNRPLGRAGWSHMLGAVAVSIGLAIWGMGPTGAMTCLAGGVVAGTLWRRWTLQRLGGDTGDTLGALQVVSHTGCLLGGAAWL
jgi:adenosylcobinamide-GDP ribazoletransferase